MVTVMRQRSFHKPNGGSIDREKAKGCFGKQLKIFTDIRPHVAYGENRTKSMRQIYAEMPRKAITRNGNQARKLRQRLANMKMPMPVGRGANP